MPPSETDRRRALRRIPGPEESLSRAKLRTGRELTVVNISSSGALVEGLTRLLPGTRADVHLVTRHGRVLVRTRIVRAFVRRLEADIVCYRSALAFDAAVDTEGVPVVSESSGPALSERSSRSERDECESNGYALPTETPRNDEGPGIRYPSTEVEGRV